MNIAKTAKVVRFHTVGGPEVLKVESVEVTAPGPGEVRLQVKAVCINRVDTLYRLGLFSEKPVFPSRLGFEAAGVVEAVGAGVENVKVGDQVSVVPGFSNRDYGTYGELILVPAYTLQVHPDTLGFEEAASLWTSYLAAYGMLVDKADIRPGQTVIINAASSGAGLASLQVARLRGAIPLALTTSEAKKAALLAAGAHAVIVTGTDDFAAQILSLTGGKGAEVILDAVGGGQFSRLIGAAAEKAKVLAYGVLSSEPAVYPAYDVLMKMITIEGYNMADLLMNPAKCQAAIEFIKNGVLSGALRPLVAKTFALDEIVEAHRYLDLNRHFGKVVLKVV